MLNSANLLAIIHSDQVLQSTPSIQWEIWPTEKKLHRLLIVQ